MGNEKGAISFDVSSNNGSLFVPELGGEEKSLRLLHEKSLCPEQKNITDKFVQQPKDQNHYDDHMQKKRKK